MQRKKFRWKAAALIALILLLLLEIGDLYYLSHGGAGQLLPILMYHHFEETSDSGTVVSADRFREQMTSLHDAGYEAVTIPQVIDYVKNGGSLPAKPVLITMDDGYTSNLTVAAPVLEELDMCATVFVIGINEGEELYVHSGEPFWQARFAYEEAADWVEKGVIDVQSHTFDMHQLASYGYSGREGVLRMEGESSEAFRQALLTDSRLFRERREGAVSSPLLALAYPFGYYDEEADQLMEEAGYAVTITIDERINQLKRNDGGCLRMMGRFNVTDTVSGEGLVARLDQYFRRPAPVQ